MIELRKRIRDELDCQLFRAEPGGELIIELPDERCFVAPDGETETHILDLLERSLQSGHNLFAEEWEPYEYDEGLVL